MTPHGRKRRAKGQLRRQAKVRKFDQPEQQNVDVLRVEDDSQFYGQIIEIEPMQEGDKNVKSYGLIFDCLWKPWFDKLQDDLSDAPPMNTIAKVARTFILELHLSQSNVDALSNSLEAGQQLLADLERVHLSQGWWLQLTLSNSSGYPVQAYLPAPDSEDPSSVMDTSEPVLIYLNHLSRVRPPSTLIKLHKLAKRT